MANKLKTELKIQATAMLCEGSSIRSVERITGIHRDTIMRLGVRVGEGCKRIMDEKMRNLPCRLIQVDEVWGYVGMKQRVALRNRATGDVGDVWTWVLEISPVDSPQSAVKVAIASKARIPK
jgi:hypothetical protein